MDKEELIRLRDEAVDESCKVVQFRGPPLRPERANPAVPEHVWQKFQELGEVAAKHLESLLTDERFPNLQVKEQMRIIETTFARAYGSVDGSVRRNINVNVNPEDSESFNALTSMSRRASRQLPEFRRATSNTTDEAEVLDTTPIEDS
jgi:hypothetical protein